MPTLDTQRYELHMPSRGTGAALDQDAEWCDVVIDGERGASASTTTPRSTRSRGCTSSSSTERLRVHVAPGRVRPAARGAAARRRRSGCVAVLDLGAGNGMVGERSTSSASGRSSASTACPRRGPRERDRPGVYEDYLVTTSPRCSGRARDALRREFDCLAASPRSASATSRQLAFAEAFNLVRDRRLDRVQLATGSSTATGRGFRALVSA